MRTTNYKCVVCNKPHYQRPSAIKKSTRGLTCGKECGSINRSKHMIGKGNHQFGVKGEANASFTSNRKISNYGYVLIYKPEHLRSNHAGYVFEHILVMEEHIGRSLKNYGYRHKYNEVCHHIDRDKQNNSIDNLQLMTFSEHIKLHHKEGDYQRDSKGRIKNGKSRM